MKQVAILGASSQISKDLIFLIAARGIDERTLYERQLDSIWTQPVAADLASCYRQRSYSEHGDNAHDAVFNFVGVVDPSRAGAMSGDIFDITLEYDEMVLKHLKKIRINRINRMPNGPPRNGSVDCYVRAPVDKPALLEAMTLQLDLQYEFVGAASIVVNATGATTIR